MSSGSAKPKHQNIFDRLTDPSQYTGAHKLRFDADGKGRGKAGRDPGVDSQTHDLSQMTRTNLNGTPSAPHSSTSHTTTHTTTHTATHTTTHTTASKPAASHSSSTEDSGEGSPKPKAKKQSIFDKLTDPSQYTGAHRLRFDADGKGLGKAGRDPGVDSQTHDLSQMTRTNLNGTPSAPHSTVGRTTRTTHPPSLTTAHSTGSKPAATHASSTTASSDGAAKPKAKKQSIFDKLTDPSQYTGAHRLRFDADGKGRGKAGRDPGVDSQTHDLSQMTRT